MTANDRLLLVLAILVGNGLATATNLAAVRLYCGAPAPTRAARRRAPSCYYNNRETPAEGA